METKNTPSKTNRISIWVCLILSALTTPAFSQTSESNTYSWFDSGMVLSILCVVALATFMFVAMFKSKNKEALHNKHRHKLHMHRKQAHIDHFKF
jgi:hypothetical protein